MSAAPSLERYQSTDTISSHDSYDSDPENVADYPGPGFPIKPVPRVPGRHPNRAATKIKHWWEKIKLRNAQTNKRHFGLADIKSILKELEDCHSEKARLEEQLEQYEGERKKGGKRRRRKTRRKTRRKKSKSKRKTKRRRKSSKRRRR